MIRATAAEVAGHRLGDLWLPCGAAAAQQGGRRDQHARGAKPTLCGIVGDKCGLQRSEPVAARKPLDGRYRSFVGIVGEHHARVHGDAVDEHHAGSAGPPITDLFATCESEMIAESDEQGGFCGDLKGFLHTVDLELERRRTGAHLGRVFGGLFGRCRSAGPFGRRCCAAGEHCRRAKSPE